MTKGHMLKNIKVYQCIFLPRSRVGADSWNATSFIWVIIWGILLQKKSLGIHHSPHQFYYFKKSVLIDKPFNLINHLCCCKYQQKLYLKKNTKLSLFPADPLFSSWLSKNIINNHGIFSTILVNKITSENKALLFHFSNVKILPKSIILLN